MAKNDKEGNAGSDETNTQITDEQKEQNNAKAAKVQKEEKFGDLDTVKIKGDKCDFLKSGKEYEVGGRAAKHLIGKGSAKYVSHKKYENPNGKI